MKYEEKGALGKRINLINPLGIFPLDRQGKRPVCPICGEDYSEHPAISRKDNKSKICPKCGTGEALMDFIDNLQKNKTTNL